MSGFPEQVVRVATIPAEGVKSLVWAGDVLIDFVSSRVFLPDGTIRDLGIRYPYRFDAAIASPSGNHVAIYERLGTKALLINRGHSEREINRSFYFADQYEYPIHFFKFQEGREILVHCPDQFDLLQMEDPVTGEILAVESAKSDPEDELFHSRLTSNFSGTRLLSAGWFWHPFDDIRLFDFCSNEENKLEIRPHPLNTRMTVETCSATFLPNGRLVVNTRNEARELRINSSPLEGLTPGIMAVIDLDQQQIVSIAQLQEEPGTMFPVGNNHVLDCYGSPKLVEVATGRVLFRWPELNSGTQQSSLHSTPSLPVPPMVYDPVQFRFALADERQITIVSFDQKHFSSRSTLI